MPEKSIQFILHIGRRPEENVRPAAPARPLMPTVSMAAGGCMVIGVVPEVHHVSLQADLHAAVVVPVRAQPTYEQRLGGRAVHSRELFCGAE